jgi:hypothetical protein
MIAVDCSIFDRCTVLRGCGPAASIESDSKNEARGGGIF